MVLPESRPVTGSHRVKLQSIRSVEDCTGTVPEEKKFLRIRRLRLQNLYEDGTTSEVYPCDVVSRPGSDAVVAMLYEAGREKRPPDFVRSSSQHAVGS